VNDQEQADQGWDRGFDDHQLRQLVRFARLPFGKKLEWLENARDLADWLQQAARAARKPTDPNHA
jgi:hypothetical protein